ncbi:MAG: hypothetical protein M1825_004430 [Sarcosagium campestre]|nr:MAG: hypothetical protein M1825_004430 [Sarcosagium campestre]
MSLLDSTVASRSDAIAAGDRTSNSSPASSPSERRSRKQSSEPPGKRAKTRSAAATRAATSAAPSSSFEARGKIQSSQSPSENAEAELAVAVDITSIAATADSRTGTKRQSTPKRGKAKGKPVPASSRVTRSQASKSASASINDISRGNSIASDAKKSVSFSGESRNHSPSLARAIFQDMRPSGLTPDDNAVSEEAAGAPEGKNLDTTKNQLNGKGQRSRTEESDTEEVGSLPRPKRLKSILKPSSIMTTPAPEEITAPPTPVVPQRRPPGRPRGRPKSNTQSVSRPTSAKSKRRGRGRKKKVHADPHVNAEWRRMRDLKKNYTALAKALKPCLQELADRCFQDLEANPEAYRNYEQHGMIQESLDQAYTTRLARLKEEARLKKEVNARVLRGETSIAALEYRRSFEEAKEELLAGIRHEMLVIQRKLDVLEDEEATDEEMSEPEPSEDAVPIEGPSRSLPHLERQRAINDAAVREHVGAVVRAFALREGEDIGDTRRQLATFDGDLRSVGLATRNVGNLADAAQEVGRQSAAETSGLRLLASAVESAGEASLAARAALNPAPATPKRGSLMSILNHDEVAPPYKAPNGQGSRDAGPPIPLQFTHLSGPWLPPQPPRQPAWLSLPRPPAPPLPPAPQTPSRHAGYYYQPSYPLPPYQPPFS